MPILIPFPFPILIPMFYVKLLVLEDPILDNQYKIADRSTFPIPKPIQSNPVLWPKVIIFGALWWPNQWFYQKRVLIWLGVDTLGYNISKDQLSRSKTVASSLKKVHFWNPIWWTPSALWDGPSPRTRLYLNQSG